MTDPARHEASFDAVHEDERRRLALPNPVSEPDGVGLAVSGGGIRSASFALGVVQHFLNTGFLQRVDYLSTVSGGGYLGSAVSWWLHQVVTDPALEEASQDELRKAFVRQFGSKVIGARTAPAIASTAAPASSTAGVDVTTRGRGDAGAPPQPRAAPCDVNAWAGAGWLGFIRQHGNYLQPPGVGVLSLAASVLRVCVYSLLVYMSAAVAFFCALEILRNSDLDPYVWFGNAAVVSAALLFAASVIYGPATALASAGRIDATRLYNSRTRFRRVSGDVLGVGLGAGVLWLLPWILEGINWLSPRLRWGSMLSASGLGAVGTIYQFMVGRANRTSSRILTQVRIAATASIVILLLLVAAYAIADAFSDCAGWLAIGTLAVALFFGFFVNTNYHGLARLYRDRLMEAFLPNPANVATNQWAKATQADLQPIAGLSGHLGREGDIRKVDPAVACQRPLHLVNCNVVLVDSTKDLYRNRGGDSFCVSNRWSGGNATGWIETTGLGDGKFSLATAMSISGAAANPDSAPNGSGVTRNRAVSFLMSLFNARLGYWLSNPRIARDTPANRPNMLVPGVRQGLMGSGLDEEAGFLELTDGGHFDNTGAYELIRRRTRLIIVCEGGQDSDFSMGDLANLIEKVRVDFSVFIEFNDPNYDLQPLRPVGNRTRKTARRGFALARVRYPKADRNLLEFDEGVLVYLQATPVTTMAADVESFWRRTPRFPNESTADQFFDEEHLEAYRELGYGIASSLSQHVREKAGAGGLPPIVVANFR